MAKLTRKQDNRPSMQWYPTDWQADMGLQMCSLAARGLWFELLMCMWCAPRRGYLVDVMCRRMTVESVAQCVRAPEAEVKQLLSELREHGVYSTTRRGVIYNRRMVRDEKQRQSKVEAGRLGGRQAKRKQKRGSSTSTSSASVLLGSGSSVLHPSDGALPDPNEPLPQTQVSLELQDLAFKTYGHIPDALPQWLRMYPPAWVPLAIKRTADQGKDRPAYTHGILEAWRKAGAPDVSLDEGQADAF